MESLAMLRSQTDEVGEQLRRCLTGLTEESLSFQVHPSSLSVGGSLLHLLDTYAAVQASLTGDEYAWGTATMPEGGVDAVIAAVFAAREQAVEGLLKTKPEDVSGWILLHDAYHVGQVCLMRQAFDPEWSSFSIYS